MFGKHKPVTTHPACVIDDGEALIPAPELAGLALEGWRLKQEIDALQDQLKRINNTLLETLEPGTALHVDGVVRIPLSARDSITISDPDALRGILGDRFPDLVESTETHKPTAKLKAMAADGDQGKLIAACFRVTTARAVSYLGGKALPSR